jgi:hypothetical protein
VQAWLIAWHGISAHLLLAVVLRTDPSDVVSFGSSGSDLNLRCPFGRRSFVEPDLVVSVPSPKFVMSQPPSPACLNMIVVCLPSLVLSVSTIEPSLHCMFHPLPSLGLDLEADERRERGKDEVFVLVLVSESLSDMWM